MSNYSAERASNTLSIILGKETPHSVSTEENAKVRNQILKELSDLGVKSEVRSGEGCRTEERKGWILCGRVSNIWAEILPGKGKAILLLAHYDSVPAGPGAGDDGSGVATILEAARALRSESDGSKDSAHPVWALLTDGEEAGLLGAELAYKDQEFRKSIGTIINVEARGNEGGSLLFQTSKGSGPLIDLYAKSVKSYATSSLYAEVFKLLPNDTDLSVFLPMDLPSWNFSFVDRLAHYHTPKDSLENLSLISLQHHGDNLLGITKGLRESNWMEFGNRKDAVYLDLQGVVLFRIPLSWVTPLSVLLLLLSFTFIIRAGSAIRSKIHWIQIFLGPLAFLILSAALGWLFFATASVIAGVPDPSYSHLQLLRLALYLGVAFSAILFLPWLGGEDQGTGVWLWYGVFLILCAFFAPGISPYFILPLFFAMLGKILQIGNPARWRRNLGQISYLLSPALSLIVWLGLAVSGESLMGLKLHFLVTIPAALGVMALFPFIDVSGEPKALEWKLLGGVALLGFLLSACSAFLPTYTETYPERLNINYVQDHSQKETFWAVDSNGPLPEKLWTVSDFRGEKRKVHPMARQESYISPAKGIDYPNPKIRILEDTKEGDNRKIHFVLLASSQADQTFVAVPKDANLKEVTIQGEKPEVPKLSKEKEYTVMACMTRDCSRTEMTIVFETSQRITIRFAEVRFGLPPEGRQFLEARGATEVQSQNGDNTILMDSVEF